MFCRFNLEFLDTTVWRYFPIFRCFSVFVFSLLIRLSFLPLFYFLKLFLRFLSLYSPSLTVLTLHKTNFSFSFVFKKIQHASLVFYAQFIIIFFLLTYVWNVFTNTCVLVSHVLVSCIFPTVIPDQRVFNTKPQVLSVLLY